MARTTVVSAEEMEGWVSPSVKVNPAQKEALLGLLARRVALLSKEDQAERGAARRYGQCCGVESACRELGISQEEIDAVWPL